jgi:hypothetical protein
MRMDEVRAMVSRCTPGLIAAHAPAVLGLAVGWLGDGPINKARADEFCLTAYVERLSRTTEHAAMWFCSMLVEQFQQSLPANGIKLIDVGGRFRALAPGSEHGSITSLNTKKWFHSLRPGIGICNPTLASPTDREPFDLCAGTSGFFVSDEDGHRYLVSCNHVIARARSDAWPDGAEHERIIQPASLDLSGHDLKAISSLSDLANRFGVARLSSYVPLRPDDPAVAPPPINRVDVAMARVDAADRDWDLATLPYGGRILGRASDYQVDKTGKIVGSGRVYKVGRTTGYTEGYVTGIGATITGIDFGGWTASFIDQLVVSRTPDNSSALFSSDGDSGSALLTDDHRIAGLIFAGGPHSTLANPVSHVIKELEHVSGLTLSVVT